MQNKDYTEDLRYCEKTSASQTFHNFDMLQKKIRKRLPDNEDQVIDANVALRQLNYFWKKGWQREHFHPFISKPISISPSVIFQSQNSPKFSMYNEIVFNFVLMRKNETEQDVTYKINCIPLNTNNNSEIFNISAKMVSRNLGIITKLSNTMWTNMKESLDQILKKNYETDIDRGYAQSSEPLKFIQYISRMENYKIINQDNIEGQNLNIQNIQHLNIFTSNFVDALQKIIAGQNGSCLFTSQPEINNLFYVLHPIFHPIQTVLFRSYQKIRHQKMKRGEEIIEPDDDAQSFNNRLQKLKQYDFDEEMPRIVMINFDGYESQFNLEFARSQPNNLMYISFDKQNIKGKKRLASAKKRFWKKVMYQHSRILSNNEIDLKEKLADDPQNYHETIDSIYQLKKPKNLNKNIYLIPIGWESFSEQFPQILSKSDMESYESNFIRFMMNDIMIPKIKEFRPTTIIVSYSGRLNIDINHFISIFQGLTSCCYKTMLFPNFTSYFCDELQEQQSEILNDNKFQKNHLSHETLMYCLQIMGIFLKISSGTYNLNPSMIEEPIITKYKNSKAFKYAYQIIDCLSHQYENLKFYKGIKTMLTPDKLYSNEFGNMNESIEKLLKCIPTFYKQVYAKIQNLILRKEQIYDKQDNYQRQVNELRQIMLQSSLWNSEDMGQIQMCLKEKKFVYFLELASQKYHETVHLYFHSIPDKMLFQKQKDTNKSSNSINSMQGVYSVSFYDEKKQIIPIHQNTQIIYHNKQINSKDNFYHVIIGHHIQDSNPIPFNYLSLVKKNPLYFKSQRSQLMKIVLLDEKGELIVESGFKYRTKWNYAQTEKYLILFWPSHYDYIRGILKQTVKKSYHPPLLNQIFIAQKLSKHQKTDIAFHRTNYFANEEICPKIGCSVYELQGKLFIFGGFYQRQKNYLNFQHDIVTFDLNNWDNTRKVQINNIKRFLYSKEVTNFRIERHQKANSYIRPRMEFQFYDINELTDEIQLLNINQQTTKVIMIGGYGQNFIRSYSLLTYYYYQLTFNNTQRTLCSVEKKIIYGKAIPINLKNVVKNKGYYGQINYLNDNNGEITTRKANQKQYLFHRLVYNLTKQSLDFKIKTFYASSQYHIFNKQFENLSKKLGEFRETLQPQSIQVINIDKVNHYVIANKQKKSNILEIFYFYKAQNQTIRLTNQSIVSIDIKNNKIYAIIKHALYTKDKCVLTACDISVGNYFNQRQNVDGKFNYVLLKFIYEFKLDLSMHTLLACNQNMILLLHGSILQKNTNIEQYYIKVKYDPQTQVHLLKKLGLIQLRYLQNKVSQCTTFIVKNQAVIQCFNFSNHQQFQQIYVLQTLVIDLNQVNIHWNQSQKVNLVFGKQPNNYQSQIGLKIQIIELKKYYEVLMIFGRYGDQEFIIQLNNKNKVEYKGVLTFFINLGSNVIQKQWNQSQIGRKIIKNINRYDDIYK